MELKTACQYTRQYCANVKEETFVLSIDLQRAVWSFCLHFLFT